MASMKRSAEECSDGGAATGTSTCCLLANSPDQVTKRLKAAIMSSLFEEGYYPSTSMPVDGWMQPCRYCQVFTSGLLGTTQPGEHVAVCRRCENKLVEYFKQVHQAQLGSFRSTDSTQQQQQQHQQQQQQQQQEQQQQKRSQSGTSQQCSMMSNAWMGSGQTSPSFSVLSLGSESAMEERMTPRG